MKNLTIIGFTDSINECDCCGKTGLKGTYVMTNEDGVELYYGTTCGARSASVSVVELKEKVKSINLESEIELLVKDATYQYLQDKVLKFVSKKGYDLDVFYKKFGVLVEDMTMCIVYSFGSKCRIIDK